MKTLIQKLPLDKDSSFIARTYRTPHYETPYHQHTEYELIVVREGYGTAFIGSYIGDYQSGDIYLLGSNLPHWFRKKETEMTGSAMVVQFQHDFIGKFFFDIPEMVSIRILLESSSKGIFLLGKLKKKIGKKLIQIENNPGFYKLTDLLTMLYEISISDEYAYISQSEMINRSIDDQGLIHLVFEYTMQNYRRKITLSEVASLTNKSVSAFCQYFKKITKLSYIDLLTQVRINHACSLLKDTDMSVTEICYESGFQNWANFSKHFKDRCRMPPTKYRLIYK